MHSSEECSENALSILPIACPLLLAVNWVIAFLFADGDWRKPASCAEWILMKPNHLRGFIIIDGKIVRGEAVC